MNPVLPGNPDMMGLSWERGPVRLFDSLDNLPLWGEGSMHLVWASGPRGLSLGKEGGGVPGLQGEE